MIRTRQQRIEERRWWDERNWQDERLEDGDMSTAEGMAIGVLAGCCFWLWLLLEMGVV
jgi:hypothetical protein